MKKIFLILLVLTGFPATITAQQVYLRNFHDSAQCFIDSSSKVRVRSIEISGNGKTKTYLIKRELLFHEGDSLIAGRLYEILEHSRQLVYNTTLFITTDVIPYFREGIDIDIKVRVKEKWYLYPLPQFQLVDRNFNEWLNTFDASLERVVYGVKFLHYNFSGRRDQLRIFLLNGYSRNLSIAYSAPYSNSKLTEGFSFGASYTQNREISFATNREGKLLQYRPGGFVRNYLGLNATYQIRKGFYNRHLFSLSYNYLSVNDSIMSKYNPGYFDAQGNSTGFVDAGYINSYVNVDNVNYPLDGKLWSFSIFKRGLYLKGRNSYFALDGSVTFLKPHGRNWYSSFQLAGKVKLPFDQPYINRRALGYEGMTIRGMEYYVVDGVATSLAKYNLRKKLFSFVIHPPFRIKALPFIPFSFFGKAYADAGYCYTLPRYASRFNNTFLYSGGLGIDILTLYDISLRVEYSVNQLGEKGLFLQSRGGF